MRSVTLAQFIQRFSTERACLEYLVSRRWPEGIPCAKCEAVTKHYLIEERKCYSCGVCGSHVHPTAGTIFHGSRTPLIVWLYVMFQMSHTRTGLSAKQVQRETGVTYKTAWRMCSLIRASLADKDDETGWLFGERLSGTVEVDETYVGGRPRYKGQSRAGRGTRKQPVVGIVERGEDGKPKRVRAFVTDDTKKATVMPIIERHVAAGSTVYTDEYSVYRTLEERGYDHDWVKHRRWEYAKEVVDYETGEILSADGANPVHTNAIEGFWSQVKGAVTSVHRGVGRDYLQRYVDECAFRYAQGDDAPLFTRMLDRAVSVQPDLRPPQRRPR